MNIFRPAEIRIIVLLSAIVLIGSVFTMLKRQGRISSLDLDMFTDRGKYKYEYPIPAKNEFAKPDSTVVILPAAELTAEAVSVNINAAGYYDLQALPGIGPAIAGKIVAYRDSAGNFNSIDDLLKVDGIGPAKLGKFRDKVRLK